MSGKQKLILCLVIVLTCVISFDRCYEINEKYKNKIASNDYAYAKYNADNYNFNQLNGFDRLKQLSFNKELTPGEYEVTDTYSNEDDTKIYNGWYIIKNENYNDRAKIIINGNEYILGTFLNSNIEANYVEVNLTAGDKVVVENTVLLKTTRIV